MGRHTFAHYTVVGVVYLFLLALLLTIIIGGKVTHQGFVLGIVSIVMGLLLIYRGLQSNRTAALVHAVLFVLLELTACIVDLVNNDPAELWFASFYAIFSVLMICEILYKKLRRTLW